VKELFSIARQAQKDRRLPGFRAQQWLFFAIAEFFLLGRWVALHTMQIALPYAPHVFGMHTITT
jgi:hypothetical protein